MEQRTKSREANTDPSEDEIEMTAQTCFNDRIVNFRTPLNMEVWIVRVSTSRAYRRL